MKSWTLPGSGQAKAPLTGERPAESVPGRHWVGGIDDVGRYVPRPSGEALHAPSSPSFMRRWAQCLSESSFLLTMLLHKSRRELLSAVFRHASAAGDEVAAVQDTDVLMEEIGQGLGGI